MRFLPAVLAAGTGAVVAYFMDPQNGRRRRALAVDRTAAATRRTARAVGRAGHGAAAEIEGRTQAMRHAVHSEPRPVANEETLADRVRSELFRDASVPKGSINLNVERECVVVLRGQVPQAAMIGELERRVRAIPGVRDVENLLHTPGTPAAMHT